MTRIRCIGTWGAGIPLLALLLCLLTSPALAQSETDWEEMMQQMAEELIEADDEQQWEAQQELLTELHEHPLNLNQASREQLCALPFLGAGVADEIIDYLATNGPMRTLGELRFIHSLTPQQREWLRLLVYVPLTAEPTYTRPNDTTWWGHAKHDLIMRADVPLYSRAGWPWGRGIANRLRYSWQQGRHLDVGLRLETDAGEQMFTGTTPFWDSYGGHAMLRDVGPLRTLIVGDYKVGFGEGLVLNNGIRFGKLSMGLWRTSGGIRPHRSTDEANFLRGAAATVGFGSRWQLTALYSYRKLDATVADDNTVQTINTSGLHRTDTELRHKNTLGSSTAALHLAFNSQFAAQRGTTALAKTLNYSLGLTALYQYYDHQFHQNAQLYRQIYPDGYQFGAAGVDYSLRSSRFYFSGETALSVPLSNSNSVPVSDPQSDPQPGTQSSSATDPAATSSIATRPPALSTLNKATYRFSPNSQLSLIQRYYGKYYYSPYASAYGENSHVQNESGITLQWDADRLGPIALRTFFDFFYSPWPRYTMTRYSTGWEGLLQATYVPRRGRSLQLRYTVKSKETRDRRTYSHRLRATYAHDFTRCWSASLTAFLHRYHEPSLTGPSQNEPSQNSESSSSNGFAIAPRADYTSPSQRLRFSVFAILFHTDDYNSRLYLYEPSLMQTFGIQQLYGHGQRLAATLRLRSADGSSRSYPSDLSSRSSRRHSLRWTAQIKAGVTHYTDRSQISSGPLLIDSPWKADIQILLRLQLR